MKKNNFWSLASLAWELGYLITIPLVLFAWAGRWMDKKFHTTPWIFLLGIGAAILLSSWVIYQKISRQIKEIDKNMEKIRKE